MHTARYSTDSPVPTAVVGRSPRVRAASIEGALARHKTPYSAFVFWVLGFVWFGLFFISSSSNFALHALLSWSTDGVSRPSSVAWGEHSDSRFEQGPDH